MPKVRISHFTIKGIRITSENSATCETSVGVSPSDNLANRGQTSETSIGVPNSARREKTSGRSVQNQSGAVRKEKQSRISKKKREILETTSEARYASVPQRKHSSIIENEIIKETARFRQGSKRIKNRHV